jgi:hypothetical protein
MKATPGFTPSLRLKLRFGPGLGLGHQVLVGVRRMLKPKLHLSIGLELRNKVEAGVVCWACG